MTTRACRASALIVTVAALSLWACRPAVERSAQAFCATLAAMDRSEVGSPADRNEFSRLARWVERLAAVAPAEVSYDVRQLASTLGGVADAGGWLTFFTLGALRDPSLAAIEGRIADFAAEHCGSARSSWAVDEDASDDTPCPGWPRLGNALTSNRFPFRHDTAGENTFSTVLWAVPLVPAPLGMIGVERGGSVEISGAFPDVRFFSLQPFDVETNSLGSLIDTDLRSAAGAGAERYAARLVFGEAPEDPDPGTIYVGRRADGGYNPMVFLVYRTFGDGRGRMVPSTGGVDLPEITVFDRWGDVVQRIEPCNPYPEGKPYARSRTRFPRLPIPDPRGLFEPGRFTTARNWGLPVDLLANVDALHLTAAFAEREGELFLVRARKPSTASADPAGPSDPHAVRAWSACAYNFWTGAASDCVPDTGIAMGADGRFTLVVGRSTTRPERLEAGHTWIDSGGYRDGRLLLRYFTANDPLAAQIAGGAQGGPVSASAAGYVPETAFCDSEVYAAEGGDGCFARHRARLADSERRAADEAARRRTRASSRRR